VIRSGVVGGSPLRRLAAVGIGTFLALSVVTPALGATTGTPASSPLSVRLPQSLVGCDPVGKSIPASTQQILSLVLPSAYVSTSRSQEAQADSFLVQAEVQSLGPLVVDYQIKPAAHWADGVPIRLADFVATWRDGAQGTGPAVAEYQLIASITSPKDPEDVVVRFKRPTASWQALFSPLLPATASESALSSCVAPTATVDLSAGPYVIIQSSAGEVTLVQNPTWWGTAPVFNPVTVTADPILDPSDFPAAGTFGYGQAAWFGPTTLSAATASPASSSRLDFSNRLVSLDYATRGATELSLALRTGISALIDRTALVDATVGLTDPAIKPATSFLYSQGQPAYPTSAAEPSPIVPDTTTTTGLAPTKPSASSAAVAQMLLAGYHLEAGSWLDASGRRLDLTLAVPQDDRWAEAIGAQVVTLLEAEGIGVSVLAAPGSFETAELVRSGRVQMAVVVRTTGPLPSQSATWFSAIRGQPGSPLWSGFSERSTNQLATSASGMMNAATASSSYSELDADLWSQMPSLPLLTEPFLLAWSSDVEGIDSNPYPPGTLNALPSWRIARPTP
jgi:peptide/nickel transport system substrate-binding protein